MSTETLEKPKTTGSDFEDDCIHDWCPCTPNLALCGWDLTGHPTVEIYPPEDECAMCLVVESRNVCPWCGGEWED